MSLSKDNHPTVEITDIVALQMKARLGEVDDFTSTHSNRERMERLVDHISLLVTIANEYHEDKHFVKNAQGIFELKPDAVNKVTRLLLHEFSLYTKDSPLSINEFQSLLRMIEVIAKKQHPNLFIVLGTIATLDHQGNVINQAVHVTCGPEPKFNLVAKSFPSDIDPVYQSYPAIEYTSSYTDTLPTQILLPEKANEIAVSYKKIFESETAGGVRFVNVLEICLDTKLALGKQSFAHEIYNWLLDHDKRFSPLVSHLLLSNVISKEDLKTENIMGSLAQADPYTDYQGVLIQQGFFSFKKIHSLSNPLFKKLENKYGDSNESLHLYQDRKQLIIRHPPFGPDVQIKVFAPHKLNLMSDEWLKKLNWHHKMLDQYQEKPSSLKKRLEDLNDTLTYSSLTKEDRTELRIEKLCILCFGLYPKTNKHKNEYLSQALDEISNLSDSSFNNHPLLEMLIDKVIQMYVHYEQQHGDVNSYHLFIDNLTQQIVKYPLSDNSPTVSRYLRMAEMMYVQTGKLEYFNDLLALAFADKKNILSNVELLFDIYMKIEDKKHSGAILASAVMKLGDIIQAKLPNELVPSHLVVFTYEKFKRSSDLGMDEKLVKQCESLAFNVYTYYLKQKKFGNDVEKLIASTQQALIFCFDVYIQNKNFYHIKKSIRSFEGINSQWKFLPIAKLYVCLYEENKNIEMLELARSHLYTFIDNNKYPSPLLAQVYVELGKVLLSIYECDPSPQNKDRISEFLETKDINEIFLKDKNVYEMLKQVYEASPSIRYHK